MFFLYLFWAEFNFGHLVLKSKHSDRGRNGSDFKTIVWTRFAQRRQIILTNVDFFE